MTVLNLLFIIRECVVLQRQWLHVQNELVVSARLQAEVADQISEARTRLAVLTRKRAVVNSMYLVFNQLALGET